jgi:hypothetical protein
MKSVILAATTAVIVIASTGMASAYDRPSYGFWGNQTPGIDRSQAIQNAEIEQGRRNGQLTGREFVGLKREQAAINDLERRAKADGVVTPYERQQIRNAQANAQRHIVQESTDNETRWSRWRHRFWN